MTLIKNARVLTMEQANEDYQTIDVLIENGKIKKLGKITSKKAEVIDAEGAILLPGFIDAHCHLGLWEDAIGFEGADGNEMTGPIKPELRAIDGINPRDRNFQDALSGGVLAVSTGPGSANVMGGTFATIKTHGGRIDDMILMEPAAMKIAFGENPKRVYSAKNVSPSTRMATAAELRQVLYKAKDYYEKKQSKKVEDRPKFDFQMEALIPVFEKKIPLKAHAHRVDDIYTAIRIAKEFDLKLTLDHVTEGHMMVEDLKKEQVGCIVGPSFGTRSKVELEHKSFETAKVLTEAGIQVAIMTDHPVIPIEHLNMAAAYCVKVGMDHYDALKALTINPAEILGVADRIGSIAVGKDADMVLWSGDPLDVKQEVIWSMIDGEIVYRRP